MMSTDPIKELSVKRPLLFKVLGRTLEHFGVQMYKRREVAIAELVANCWDAGAMEVFVDVPEPAVYDQSKSRIIIRDCGCGMSFEDVQGDYLVLGRNRRLDTGAETQTILPLGIDVVEETLTTAKKVPTRRVMGRKGIGKLAGFGLAQKMTVTTWRGEYGMEFHLDLKQLKLGDNDAQDVPISWNNVSPQKDLSPSGTIVTLEILKHKASMDPVGLARSLARRFSRFVKGQMTIRVNGIELPDPTPALDFRQPAGATHTDETTLSNGQTVRYWYGFAHDVIHERELRGFSILVHGKVAHAPPFFFDTEAKASGQHSTRYVIGEIEADFIDVGVDDESDLVSTDRQELDWESEELSALKKWGEILSKKVLSDCRDFRGKKTVEEVMTNPELVGRIKQLESPSQREIERFLTILGNRDGDDGRTIELASSLVRAYEFRQFHDVISEIESAADDPNRLASLLQQMHEWKVLESRAILEIIRGRLDILDKFEKMLCNDAPETASAKNPENLHDLLGGNPWLLNSEWQVLAEEKRITTQLREWGAKDLPDYKGRYDFLALGSDSLLVIIEIKRPEHPAELTEMNRLIEYQDKLSIGHARPINMVFICGRDPKVSRQALDGFDKNPHYEIRYWSNLFEKTRRTYEHYRAVLEGSVSDPAFHAKQVEVLATRKILDAGIRRGTEEREKGIPAPDIDFRK